jgi:peptide/nickel transport system permease protein
MSVRASALTGTVLPADRLGQFALVVFIGINIAFIVTHATPIDPVEQSIAMATQFGTPIPRRST